MSLFNFSGYPIGLDISDTGLKLVELGKKGKKIIFQAVGRADLPPGLVENGQIINQAEIAKKIKNALDQPLFGKFSAATVALSLPEAKSFAKLIYVEKSPNPLPAAVDAEIGKYVPYENDEIFYDWQKIGEDRDRHHIFFSACAKTDFMEYEQLLNAAGLKIEAAEPEAVALCRALLPSETPAAAPTNEENAVGIIDIGAQRTHLVFYGRQSVLFSISLPICGQEITKQISVALEVPANEAEKAKIVCGLDENIAQGVIRKILTATLDQLFARLQEALLFEQKHYPDIGPIKEVILCGGGANIKGLDSLMANKLGLPARLGRPGQIIANSENHPGFSEIHRLEEKSPDGKTTRETMSLTQNNINGFAAAIGLALRGPFFE